MLLIICITLYFTNNISLFLGNIFFGNTPKLYNVKIAQKFYKVASYPYLGKAPPFAHYQLSRTYFIQGLLDQSIEEAKKELELYPDNFRTHYIVGLTLGYMNKEDEAIEAFSRFIEYVPQSWAARNDKAWLQFRIGDIDGAIQTLQPVVETYPRNIWVQNTYCVLLINKKRYEEAETSCARAMAAAHFMKEEDWGNAYPGNNPKIYGLGMRATKEAVKENFMLLDSLKK